MANAVFHDDEHPEHGQEAKFGEAAVARKFIMSKKANFTLRSTKTGNRFTYRVRLSKDNQVLFVGVLTGSNNEGDYQFLGIIKPASGAYYHGRKSRIARDATSAVAFEWSWRQLSNGRLPTTLEIWHAGQCARCGRKLTVPESIASGFGPECLGKGGY